MTNNVNSPLCQRMVHDDPWFHGVHPARIYRGSHEVHDLSLAGAGECAGPAALSASHENERRQTLGSCRPYLGHRSELIEPLITAQDSVALPFVVRREAGVNPGAATKISGQASLLKT